ncbi:prolyl endopeptidase-like [Brachionichthys hirsutus]|uniref:prolyl endopeptidase-like n=1 Tax=Brachionichthys hirsutus TaxID=412623 RepID=UPI003604CD70
MDCSDAFYISLMALFLSLLSPSARRFAPYRLKAWAQVVRRRLTRLSTNAQRCYSSETSDSSVDSFISGFERYRDLKKYFNRTLKATYRRFYNTPDHSEVCGHHHVYFIEKDGICRMDKRQSKPEPELVLNLERVSELEMSGLENEAWRHQWTVLRIRLSPQEKHLAATLKADNSKEMRCVVVRLEEESSPPLDPHHVLLTLDSVFTFEWATDEVLFYTTLEGLRCHRVFRLDLTSGRSGIRCVYAGTRPDVFVELSLSRDRRLLGINCSSRTASEVLLIDASSHLEPFLVQPFQPDLLYHVEHWRGWLIILASAGPAREYQVMRTPLSEPAMASWDPLFVPDPGTIVKDMDVVGDHCVLVATAAAGGLFLIVFPLTRPEDVYTVQLPCWACAIRTTKPSMADQHSVFDFLISSPVRPPEPYRLHPEAGLLLSGAGDECSVEHQGNYITSRLEARSQDGASVPVTLFHTLPIEDLRRVPLLVHVYGAYGRDLNMEFCPEKRLLLERGWALAYCHIRGGAERGLFWHRQARVEGKPRGVEDLRSCLHRLSSSGVSSPSLTALTAFSAGAVPVGALCNTHPHMMRAVTLQAPFLDVLGTMEDPSLPLTLEDREEWGDPVGNPNHRLTISSYCPLRNITPQCYPSILLTAYRGDARVPVSGVLEYTERLNDAIHTHFAMKPETDSEPAPRIVLNIQPGSDHLGPEDFDSRLEEEALKLAFLYAELGLDRPRPPRKRRR